MKIQSPKSIRFTKKSLKWASAGLTLLAAIAANNAKAQTQYFQPVTTGNTYSWDAADWSANNAANASPYTSTWVSGNFARFYNDASAAYTVTVNAAEQNTGLYQHTASATLTIADAGNGTGNLDVINAIQGFLVAGTLNINAPITGNGGIAPESTGSLHLNAANTYTGGTALGDSGNTLTYFNNNNAFSTGGITLNRTGIANFSTLLPTGGSPLAIANPVSITSAVGTGTALNIAGAANTPLTSSGTWTLGTYNLNLRNAGGSTAPVTISGAISGSGSLIMSANGTGSTTILSGANPFSGSVTLTGSGGTYGGSGAITLQLGAANTLASASSLVLSGGTLNAGGYNQAMSGTLGLTSASTLMFGASAGTALSFANSSGLTWAGTINLADWVGNPIADGGTSTDTLEIGTSASGLTSAQLADIEFDGNAGTLGTAALDANGFVYQVPEPSTVALGVIGAMTLLGSIRRRMS